MPNEKIKLLDKYQWVDADLTPDNNPEHSGTYICFTIDTFNKMESDIEFEVQELKDKLKFSENSFITLEDDFVEKEKQIEKLQKEIEELKRKLEYANNLLLEKRR